MRRRKSWPALELPGRGWESIRWPKRRATDIQLALAGGVAGLGDGVGLLRRIRRPLVDARDGSPGDLQDRLDDDPRIQQQAGAFDVLDVELDPLLEIFVLFAGTFHLP